MKRWTCFWMLTLAAALGALGCGSSNSSNVTITVSPTSASVITNRTQQFSALVTGSSNTSVTWTLACQTGVTAGTCGTIDSTGLYTAPATIPTITSSGTTTMAPAVTITGTAQADTTKFSNATLTIVTGISISITPSAATVGTNETFTFQATVNNPGCNPSPTTNCGGVTWSLPASSSTYNPGTITAGTTQGNVTAGNYTAPSAVPSPSRVVVTATSASDTSVTATATVTVVTAATPTVDSVSPNTTALGAAFQDIYITGTNFISTNIVYLNGVPIPAQTANGNNSVNEVSGSLIRARIPDLMLANPPSSGVFQVSVSEQKGAPQACGDTSQCEITVLPVRPGLIGPSPVSAPQSSLGTLNFNVDGGFFGIKGNQAVNAYYDGSPRLITLPVSSLNGGINSTRQLTVSIGGAGNANDLGQPGLHQIKIQNAVDPSKFAIANLAVQPAYGITPIKTDVGVGTTPSDIAINPATGMAVVADTASNDVSIFDATSSNPTVTRVCTATTGTTNSGCASAGPTSVAIDYVNNKALVVNSVSKTVATVDLNTTPPAVTSVSAALQDTPIAIGVNPLTGQALVAMQQKGYGILMDTIHNKFTGVVTISTGQTPHIAVDPNLNWALVTPGGAGSLGIVDLGQQNGNAITAISRTTNVVTVTINNAGSAPPLSVQVGDTVDIDQVQISTQADAGQSTSFDGFYTVTSVGPASNQFSYSQTGATLPDVGSLATPDAATGSVDYSQPIATAGLPITVQGVSINPETRQAALTDPSTGGGVLFFSLIDQSVTPLNTGNAVTSTFVASAYNPLTDIAVAVDDLGGTLSVIDPTAPRQLNSSNLYTGLSKPVAVAIDPVTNIAAVVNQGNNTVSLLALNGTLPPLSITQTSPKTLVVDSSLGSAPTPAPLTLTVIGSFDCPNSPAAARLDGVTLKTLSCSARELTAVVPPSMLASAHRYTLDVSDGTNVSNAEDFTVEQSVDMSSACATAPLPSGVAVDPVQNLAVVSLNGCNSVALMSLADGTGRTVAVGTSPIGVAVIPRLHYAVVANNGSSNASIIDELQASVVKTVGTGTGPIGAAADEQTGEVAIANSITNTISVVNAANGAVATVNTGPRPVAVAFNYVNHQVAAAATSGNGTIGNAGSLNVSDASASTQSTTFSVNTPTSVVYDPMPDDCGANTATNPTLNTVGCFIVASSTSNEVYVIDPVNSIENVFRVGINPTAVAYNYLTSRLVTTNTGSHTITVADFLSRQVRAILSLPTAPTNAQLATSGLLQFGLDVHPFTNVAVVADTANGRVLFIPLPY